MAGSIDEKQLVTLFIDHLEDKAVREVCFHGFARYRSISPRFFWRDDPFDASARHS